MTLASATRSTTADAYNWIGVSGGTWEGLGNWADTTSGTSPAAFVPGTLTPATIVGPTGSTFEVISGGGVASSLALTGNVGLGGAYTVSNALTIGGIAPSSSNSYSITYTVGSLSLSTGTIAAGSVNILDGALALAAGTGLSASSIAAGTSGGYSSGALSTISLASGATMSTTGALLLANTTLNDVGGTVTSNGTLTVGTAQNNLSMSVYPIYSSSSQVNISAGGTLTAAAINQAYGVISVRGPGSKLVVNGTLTASAGDYPSTSSGVGSGALLATIGGSAQIGSIVLSANSYGTYYTKPNISVDATSTIEVGVAGGAAAGSITVDAGKSIAVSIIASLTGALVDNGTVSVTAGATLTQIGTISGSGTLQIGKNSTLQLNGTAAATNTIAFQDIGAALSIGSNYNYNPFGGSATTTPYTINATITGFQTGDSIIFVTPVTTATFTQATGTLVLANGTTTVETLHLTGDFTGENFFISPTTNNGASISLIASATTTAQPITIGGVIGATQTAANATAKPFAVATITDPNAGAVDTATVTEDMPANGTLASSAGGTFNATTGIYTVSGSASAVQAALQALTFTPVITPATGQTTRTNLSLTVSDGLGASAANTAASVVVAPPGPRVVNSSDGTSSSYAPNPSPTVTQTITRYSGSNGTGNVLSNIVDNADSTSLLYAYNPTTTVKQTASKYAGTDSGNGAPSGAKISDVIDNTDGSSLVYAYNPSSTVKQVTTKYSATDPANGAPAGTRISDVVDNTDGTSLVYAYNPSSTVKQVTSKYSGTDPSNGAPIGAQISAVVDNTDGTALVYAYKPTSSITLTATLYSSTDPINGAPTGSQVTKVFDYVNGQSSVQTFNADGSSATLFYAGLDGAGGQIPALSPFTVAASAAASTALPVNTAVSVSASGQTIDPGLGNATIQFLPGAASDTIVFHPGSLDRLIGFSAASDTLDFTAFAKEAGVTPGTGSLFGAVTIVTLGADALVQFNPNSFGAGSTVAVLQDLGRTVTDPSMLLIKGL